ncbi:Cx9C motif-containing protein 4, mitochondrial [Fusarium falciforme]|nr:Cx9C motif-containing protein 4, mitochondrial [Fusarium falciforme]
MKAPKDDVEAKPACHPRACAIQNCLTRNGYNEDKCQNVIRQLYECCEIFYERYGEEASTVSCPKPYLLKLKMKQLREEGK